MKQGSTLFLKGVLCVIALAVLVFCIWGLPAIIQGAVMEWPQVAPLQGAILFILWLTALPFFMALYQAFRLLHYIDTNTAFSRPSVDALRYIKYSALVMSGLYMLAMPVIFIIARADNTPSLIIIGVVWACAPIVVAVFAAVLEKLLYNVMDLKSENDLTV